MKSRYRRRQRVEEPEEPFAAGLHDREEVSLALYGLPATPHPVDQVMDEDEAAELLPWPEGAPEPVMVDRFDARLLLQPLELALPPRSSATALRGSQELEEELDFERWRDLWALQRRQWRGSVSPSPSSSGEEGGGGEGRAAVEYGYEESDARLRGLEPPPPPPVGALDADPGAALLEPGALAAALQGRVPFTGTQLALMQRAAEFVRRCGEPGAALLHEAAAEDPSLAFCSPDHLWYDFFQGLVEHKASLLDNGPPGAQSAVPAAEEGGGGGGDDDGGLGSLLGEYMSDEDDIEDNEPMDALTQALIERFTAAAARGGPELAALVRERLSGDPAIGCLDPDSTHSAAFRASLEEAGLPEETVAAWTGAPPTAPPAEPAAPADERPAPGVAVQVAPITYAAAPVGAQGPVAGAAPVVGAPPQWLIEKMRAAAGVSGQLNDGAETERSQEVDAVPEPQAAEVAAEAAAAAAAAEAKKTERRRKVLERQRRLEEERRQGQAAARQQAEEERQRHLAAISQHKKIFLDDDD